VWVDRLVMLVRDWDTMLGDARLVRKVKMRVVDMNDLVGRVEREMAEWVELSWRERLLFDVMR